MAGITLIRSSKITATIAQIDNYNAAVNSFKKTYGYLPGDLPNADTRLPNCVALGSFQGCHLDKSGGVVSTVTCYQASKTCGLFSCDSAVIQDVTSLASGTPYNCKTNDSLFPEKTTAAMQSEFAAFNTPGGGTKSWYYRTTSNTATIATGQIGDGAVGPVSWDMLSYRAYYVIGKNKDLAPVDAETLLFWYELQQAGLASGVTDLGMRSDNNLSFFGKTSPAAEIDGGFWAGYSDGCCGAKQASGYTMVDTGRPKNAGNYSLNGNILTLLKYPRGSRNTVSGTVYSYQCVGVGQTYSCGFYPAASYMLNLEPNDNVLTPKEAFDMDKKLDDGFPASGIVQAYGSEEYCYKPDGNGYVYDVSVDTKSCGLYIKISE